MLPSPIARSLIVGGEEISLDSWPSYAAAFAWTGIGGAGWGCGGSLIHDDVVLTAAHCQWVYRDHGAWIGTSQIDGTDKAKFWPTKELIIHPSYTDQKSVYNDIMLVKLQDAVSDVAEFYDYNADVNVPEDGEEIRVIGFGTTQEGGSVSQTLRQVDVQAVDNANCEKTWPQFNSSLHLCAGTAQGGKDACDSDSGSPLFVLQQGRMAQVGIVGDGIGCGLPGVPSLNTRVSTYADWIHRTVCEVSSHPPPSCHAKHTYWSKLASVTDSNSTLILPKWLRGPVAALTLVLLVSLIVLYGRIWNSRHRRRRQGYQVVSNEATLEAQLTV